MAALANNSGQSKAVAILFGRGWWLAPLTIPQKQLQCGSLWFTCFMISEPKPPDSSTGRMLFALLVAAGGAFVQFGLFRATGLLRPLLAVSTLTFDHRPAISWNKISTP